MNTQLYIPKKIKVGYQTRDDTYSKKLAYIIYYDDKGVLRKEKSWEGWRDKKIDAEDYENKPQGGFVLHKDINRYNWGHFSSGRTMIRVYDPRGIEFEITTENLIGVLMNSDCSKRGLSGEYVYAWSGTELVLLPTSAEEYEKAAEFTSLQAGKIGAKDLVPGCSYKTKRDGDIIYIGRFNWHQFKYGCEYTDKPSTRTCKKFHIFTKDGKTFETKSNLDFLSMKNSDEIVSNYAKIIENFQKDPHSSKIVKCEFTPVTVDFTEKDKSSYYSSLKREKFFTYNKHSDSYTLRYLNCHKGYNSETKKNETDGYTVSERYTFSMNGETVTPTQRDNRHYWSDPKKYTAEEIQDMNFGNVTITLENGKTVSLEELHLL